jgi:hypothetical protein
MSSDYKWDIQMRAEELAEEEGVEFYHLPSNRQDAIYRQATDDWRDAAMAAADAAHDRAKEVQL